ncbi:MAG: CBS domain-containing protein [Planctomycetes bacterium]|nr:CBS domain-containing protein [Planctomycetota bacterium]
MKSRRLEKYMVPLSEYAVVDQFATLYEAVMELERAQKNFSRDEHWHRAVLVRDDTGKIVGKLSQWDVIKALEPRYKDITEYGHSVRFGFSPQFIKSMVKSYDLWSGPLQDVVGKAAKIIVKDIMYTPAAGEYVHEDASFDEAVHMLVIGHHQSLLVTDKKGNRVIGVLRLVDVFNEICRMIKAAKP